jgi:hypothetical protein
MLHPVLESLFLLKVARGYVVESIVNSDVEDQQELVNYIQNEASDFEVMHLVTLGEMPEEKFDDIAEGQVWDMFKEAVILNASELNEDMYMDDIMTIVYEMGPVSEMGYSSATPILEFAKANGTLDNEFLFNLTEDEAGHGFGKDGKGKGNAASRAWRNTWTTGARGARAAGRGIQKSADAVGSALKSDKGVGYAAAGAAGVAGIYGLYKLIKHWKAKKAAAKTPEAKKAAEAKIASANKKIKEKKARA